MLWLLAGMLYLTSETIAASAFAGYDYARNYISDLGIPYPFSEGGRLLTSPRAAVMNLGGFILDGLFYGAATIQAFRAARPGTRTGLAFLVLALVHSAGTILVGSVHSGPREIAAGVHHFHVMGAAMAIIGGNAASLLAGGLTQPLGLPPAWRRASLALGLFGLLNLALLEINRVLGTAILPDGVFERASVYPITAWEIMTGLSLLIGRRA